MSVEADRRVIIIGNDLLAVALAAGLARHQIPVHVLVESVTSRARITGVPGLLIPSGPGMTQTQLQRYERWLADLQVDPTAIAFDVLPVAAVHTPQAGTSTFPEIGVVDLTRLRSALRQRLDAMSALIEPARGAQPQWEGQQVVGARQRDGAVVSAREVVLASGLKAGRFWRLPRPAVDLERWALLRARESGLGTRYMFPFDGSVWVAGDAAPTPAEFPLLAGNGGERAQRLRGIGAEPSLRPYAVQRHALGLLYVWGAAGRACSRCRRWFAACCRSWTHYCLKEGLIMGPYYDVIVLGSGLSACEAAHAAARLGCRTLLIAQNLSRLADISLNARMGGPVRGILVREVDALGGLSGRAADAALLHIRLLNETRGPAQWALRAAVDPEVFAAAIRQALAEVAHLTLQEGVVTAVDRDAAGPEWVVAVRGAPPRRAQAVVLAFGTTVHQHIHVGRDRDTSGGADMALVDGLAALVPLERYHIAHPPLIDRTTVDVAHTEVLHGSSTPLAFAHAQHAPLRPQALAAICRECVQHGWRDQLPSYRLATTLATNAVVASAWSPVTRGLTSRGPEGCDPLELIVAGVPAARQALVLEPASWSVGAVYLRGAYTALGVDDQVRFIETLPGLERARLLRPGMLVEYDGLAPRALGSDLGVRGQAGLYAAGAFAGVNGNEESAALGMVAGINAARYAQRRVPIVPRRADAYVGVLVDDLSRGAGLPYRIANARVADRTGLRHDNADLRLTPLAGQLGLVARDRVLAVQHQQAAVDAAIAALRRLRVVPSGYVNARLAAVALAPLRTTATAEALLRRPRTTYAQLQQALDLPPLEAAAAAVVEAEVQYTAMRGMPARHAYQREPTGSAAVSAGCPSCSGGSRGGSCSV